MAAIPSREGKKELLDQSATFKEALRKSGRSKRLGFREQSHRIEERKRRTVPNVKQNAATSTEHLCVCKREV